MSNRAWVTLATNDSYGLGALVLAHSLRRVGSEVPTVVLITPSVTDAMRERLNAVFTEVVTVDVLDSRDAAHLALLQRPELGITFTKIHCWNLTQYEKCVFLDADTLVVQNCDELFEREELSAAPDVGWPDCFNSGVFVFKPSSETFDRLIAFAQERGSFDGGDQGLLNSFFSDWARSDINKHLPFLYNVTSAAFYSYLPALKHFGQDLKIIHFIGAAKPWLQHFNFESRTVDAPDHIRGLLQLWWDIFVSQVHLQLDTAMVEVEKSSETPPALPPHDVSQHYHYQPAIDPESEFPWHWPEAQATQQHSEKNQEIPNAHDRWELYRGNIPPMAEHHNFENQEAIRKYAWDYQHQGHRSHEEHSQPHTHHTPTSEHYSHDPQRDYNQHSTYGNNDQQSHHEHWHHDSSDHFHQDDNHYEQTHQETHHTPNQDQSSHYYDHSKDYQNDSFSPRTESVHHFDGHESQKDTYHQLGNSHINVSFQNNVEVHHVHVQKNTTKNRRPRRHRIDLGTEATTKVLNGEASDSENEYIEDIIPRHPYDGFYLRHRTIIDCRGHKVCTHEVPLTPSPTTLTPSVSPSLQDYDTAEDNLLSDTEDHSGVAGNLARVVAGGPYEALDDLTRRQGWEAGNIDYMGADSFDNIWAKISQSLTQPRSSPPKESPPQEIPVQVDEVAKEVVSEPVEVAKEAASVAAPAPITPTPVAEISKPVSEPTPASVAEKTPVAGVLKPVSKPTLAPVAEPTPVVAAVGELAAPATVESPKVPVKLPTTKAPAPVVPKVETPVASIKPATLDDIPVSVVEDPKKTEPKISVALEKAQSAPAPKCAPAAPTAQSTPATPVKVLESCPVATDSPPLANTPSKEEAPVVPAAKSEERRKVGKLQLCPPASADPLPTPDSELEDAASLAHAIITSELRDVATPTVTSPQTPASPASHPLPFKTGLTVEEPQVPTPPVGSISLAQIGVKPKEKSTTAAQLESSIAAATDKPLTPEVAPKDAPKKKIVKKVVKKDKDAAASGIDAPVPPPRKKEKKPKEK